MVIFIYISQAHAKTKLTDDPCIFAAMIALTYTVCVFFISDWSSVYFSPVNPAVSIAIQITARWAGNSRSLENYGIYLLGPFIGALLAALIFELGYKPIVEKLEGPQEHEVISLYSQSSEDTYKSEPMIASLQVKRPTISSDSSEDSQLRVGTQPVRRR